MRELWQEIGRVIQLILGKKSLEMWKETAKVFIDDTISEYEGHGASFYSGQITFSKAKSEKEVKALVVLYFRLQDGQTQEVSSCRMLKDKSLLLESRKRLAEQSVIIFPIEKQSEV